MRPGFPSGTLAACVCRIDDNCSEVYLFIDKGGVYGWGRVESVAVICDPEELLGRRNWRFVLGGDFIRDKQDVDVVGARETPGGRWRTLNRELLLCEILVVGNVERQELLGSVTHVNLDTRQCRRRVYFDQPAQDARAREAVYFGTSIAEDYEQIAFIYPRREHVEDHVLEWAEQYPWVYVLCKELGDPSRLFESEEAYERGDIEDGRVDYISGLREVLCSGVLLSSGVPLSSGGNYV